jgi:hypothetical protein
MAGAALFGVLLESPFMAIPYYFLLGLGMKLAQSPSSIRVREQEREVSERPRGALARGLS